MELFEYIDAIRTDNENEECWRSENYLNEQYKTDPNKCIEMVCSAFRYENYHYAESVIFSIMISDINYLVKWFKDLLLEGKGVPLIKDYANDIYEMYAETFDKI